MKTSKELNKKLSFNEIAEKLKRDYFADIFYNNKIYRLVELVQIKSVRTYRFLFTLNELSANAGFISGFSISKGILSTIFLRYNSFYIFVLGDQVYCLNGSILRRAYDRANKLLLKYDENINKEFLI